MAHMVPELSSRDIKLFALTATSKRKSYVQIILIVDLEEVADIRNTGTRYLSNPGVNVTAAAPFGCTLTAPSPPLHDPFVALSRQLPQIRSRHQT
eukprot:6177992-Pleurochrysis_carterae.AAC.1